MNRTTIFLLLIASLFSNSIFAQSDEDAEQYIEKYKALAMQEQIRTGVPAAITLAQGIHESASGKSMLAVEANNHFGIKCKSTWKGETILHDDDARQECFRKYANDNDSYIDHSNFLKENNRYHFLFDIEVTDYKGWASGLKRAGYATNPMYVSRLTNLIEKFNLQEYTYEALKKVYQTPGEVVPNKDASADVVKSEPLKTQSNPTPTNSTPATEYYKGLKGFGAKKGETLTEQSLRYKISYSRLLMLNDLEDQPLAYDQFIFTERKRKVGTEEYHIVRDGENMHLISQMEAMQLHFLYTYNNLLPGEEPAIGESLNLQYKSLTKPRLRSKEKDWTKESSKEIVKEEKKIEVSAPAPALKKETEATEIVKNTTPETVVPVVVEEKVIPIAEEKKEEAAQEEVKSNPATNNNQNTNPNIVINPQTSPILDEDKALKVEALLSTDNKKEVEALADKAREEEEERRRKEKEMMERFEANEKRVKEITQKIDEDRAKQEAIQDEEIKKRRAMEETERIRIEQEQVERDRIEAERLANAEHEKVAQAQAAKIQEEKIKQAQAAAEKAKRKYNEPGISDSVKNLKQKFDDIVYRPLPERKIATPAPVQKDSIKKITPATKPATIKTAIDKKGTETPAKPKESNVQKTPTGVKRTTDAKSKETTHKKETSTPSTDTKKVDKKADAKKETTTAKDKKATEKKGAVKKDTKKDIKKTPEKKDNSKAKSTEKNSKSSDAKKGNNKKADPKKSK